MATGKITEVLKSLNPKEFRKLGMFISSPYHNTNAALLKLYNLLKNYYPAFNTNNLSKEEIFSYLYPDKSFKDGTIRNLFSDFNALVLRFITEINFENDIYDKKNRLAEELNKRNLDNLHDKVIKENELLLNEISSVSFNFFHQAKLLEDLKINFGLERGMQKNISVNILKRSELEIFDFVINLLNDIHNLRINKEAYNSEYTPCLADEIISKLNFENILKRAELMIPEYYEIFKLFLLDGLSFLKLEDDNLYFEFKNCFFKNYDILKDSAKENFFTSLENICLEKKMKGNENFVLEEFNVYKERLVRNAFRDETGKFNIYLFRNILLTAVSNREINWLEKFVTEYSPELPNQFKVDMIKFANSIIYFEKREYKKALEALSLINDKAEIFKFYIYTLKVKIFYETGELNAAEYVIDSFNHFISNNDIVSERYKIINKNFIKAFNLLLKLKTKSIERSEKRNLEEYIKGIKYLKERHWLLKMMEKVQ